jgi:hypothetical protein
MSDIVQPWPAWRSVLLKMIRPSSYAPVVQAASVGVTEYSLILSTLMMLFSISDVMRTTQLNVWIIWNEELMASPAMLGSIVFTLITTRREAKKITRFPRNFR